MKKLFAEFKEFLSRGNVLDMAVGVIVATAFGKITTSLVNDVFMPFIGWLIGGVDLAKLNITLAEAVMDGETVVKEAVDIGSGTYITTIIDFLIIALCVFLVVKGINTAKERMAKKEEAAAEEPAAEPEPSKEEVLLAEIRDLLKEKN